jgi:hypothetical protein
MEELIDAFITEHEIDTDLKGPLCECFSACMGALAKHIMDKPIPDSEVKATKSQKVLKADKIDDPSGVQSIDELKNCTTGVLNEFCRKNSLKIGGNKKDLMDRVWRHLQGTGSDEDKSSRGKPKKEKSVTEKHECSGCNAKGAPCAVSGSEAYKGHWFCWRHILDPDAFIALKNGESSEIPEKNKVKKAVAKHEKKGKKAAVAYEEELVEESD